MSFRFMAIRSTDEFVVLAMCPDPETHANTVEATVVERLEVQRWMRRIGLELGVASVGKGLNVSRQRFEAAPEAR